MAEWSNGGTIKYVKYFLEKGEDVNAKTDDGYTALIKATITGKFEIVKLLIENKADVNVKNENGLSALMLAAYGGNLEIKKQSRCECKRYRW